MARYRGMQQKTLITRHGLLAWTRPTYYCDACRNGSDPLDRSLGLDKGQTTPQVRLWVAYLAPLLGFAESAEALRTLRALDLSSSTVERIAVCVGTSLRKAELAEADLHAKDCLPDKRTACPKRLYIGADAIMTPLREEWKKDGSQGKLKCRFGGMQDRGRV